MKRRDFVKRVCGTLAVVPLGIAAMSCGDDDDDDRVDSGATAPDARPIADASPGQVDAAELSCTEMIGTNHGHQVEIPEADVQAGLAKTYALTVGGDHGHTLSLSAANMSLLADRGSVTVETSIDPSVSFGTHAHNVTVTCS